MAKATGETLSDEPECTGGEGGPEGEGERERRGSGRRRGREGEGPWARERI